MSASEATGRILLVGDSRLNAPWLLAAIRGQDGADQSQDCYEWRLDTKYYTADVQIDVRHVEQCAQLQLSEGYEAVLMVFDAGEQSTFESVHRWYQAAGGEDAELGVRLAVAVSDGGSPPAASWLAAAEDWCAERLVELVEVRRWEQHAQQRASPHDDATGVLRIREALEAHMWPGLQLKPSPRHGQGFAAAAAATTGGSQQVEDAAPGPSLAGEHSANGHAGRVGGEPPEGEDLSFADYLRAPNAAVAAGGPASGAACEGEAGVEQLERLFAEVASELPAWCARIRWAVHHTVEQRL